MSQDKVARIFESIRRTQIGGAQDAWPVAAGVAGVISATPMLQALLPPMATPILLITCASWLTYRLASGWINKPVIESSIRKVKPKKPPFVSIEDRDNCFLFGYSVKDGSPLYVPYDLMVRHMLTVGASGIGKTVLGKLLIYQQIRKPKAGLLFIDGKMNSEDLHEMHQLCCLAGRENDFLVINPGNPEMSNTYNPILYGDPDEVASRILLQIPDTQSAGSDHYKQSANQAISTLISALQCAGLAYSFIDISILLQNSSALEELETRILNIAPDSEAAKNFSIFLDQYRLPVPGRPDLPPTIDSKRVKDTFGGIGGRLFNFGTNKFGQVMNTYDPDVNLYRDILAGKIIYCMLPTMGKSEAAQNMGKMVVGDLRTAISWMMELPLSQRPQVPFYCFFDEAGSYINSSWSRMFEQSRASKIFLAPAIQTLANFKAVSDELSEMIIGNTWIKVFFKVGSQATADECSELIGERTGITRTLTGSATNSASNAAVAMTPTGNLGEAAGLAEGEREMEMPKVTPGNLKELGFGECFVTVGGGELYHIKVPMLTITDEAKKSIPPLRINRKIERPIKGANFFKNSDNYLSKHNFLKSKAPKKKPLPKKAAD